MSSGHRKRQSFEERYWLKAVKNGPNDCWGWNGAIDGHGYGHLASRDNPYKNEKASRASWIIHKGEIPLGICVLHKCDNRICSNPNHLFLGTKADNTADMYRKKRNKINPPKGEGHANSKLNNEEILCIFREANLGMSLKDLARQFGVTKQNIWYIKKGKTWGHLTGGIT